MEKKYKIRIITIVLVIVKNKIGLTLMKRYKKKVYMLITMHSPRNINSNHCHAMPQLVIVCMVLYK